MTKNNNKPKAILPRGFKDNEKQLLTLRKIVTEVIEEECQKFGFVELETSSIEYTDSLGKFLPDIDRPSGGVFSLQDEDGQWLSLRYDLTAPLARYVAQNYQNLVKPFKRYQSGIVWRNEKPGPGRFREFLQFDADVIGIQSNLIDAELCVMVVNILRRLGLNDSQFKIKYSNRKIWTSLFEKIKASKEVESKILRAVDKKDRLGDEGVKELLCDGRKDKSGDFMEGVGLDNEQASMILDFMNDQKQTSDDIDEFNSYLGNFADYPISFDPSIVRGLDYYTGMIFEAELLIDVKNTKGETIVFGSVAGGGRYDKLISRFGKEDVPATGISVGVDRLIVALEQLDLIKAKSRPLVIVANLGDNNLSEYIRMASEIRDAGMACEISFGSKNLAKQLKYCDRKQADAVVIAGDDEIKNNKISLKDLKKGSEISKNITGRKEWKETKAGQKEVIREDLVSTLKEILKI